MVNLLKELCPCFLLSFHLLDMRTCKLETFLHLGVVSFGAVELPVGTQFPTEAVRLKVPFSTKPWTSSESNIGNLLMVPPDLILQHLLSFL